MTGDLSRFLEAQGPIYGRVLAEIRAGRKETHWTWFIFPQIRGLGGSSQARRFAIGDLDEARAYLEHPVLGARLVECALALLAHRTTPIREIMEFPDDLKVRSSMTLFLAAQPTARQAEVFDNVIVSFFQGCPDEQTHGLIRLQPEGRRVDLTRKSP